VAIISCELIFHTDVQNLVHFSFCKRFSFSFYLVLVFQKDLVLVLVTKISLTGYQSQSFSKGLRSVVHSFLRQTISELRSVTCHTRS